MNKMSWSIKQWKDVLSIVNGKNQKEVQSDNGMFPIIGSGGEIGRANDFLCEAGSTVVGRKGTINKPFFVGERFWNVDTAFGIQPGENLNPKFLFYFCKGYNFKKLDKSTTIPSLAKTDLLKIEMPVPSLDEQEKIVNRIEELFSELDSAVETLKKTKEQLAVYRQSVLKDAFEEIQQKTTLEQCLAEKPRNGYSEKAVDYETRYKNLTLTATTSGVFKENCFKYIDIDIDENSYLWVKKNDILIQRANTLEYVGTSVIYLGEDNKYVYPDLIMKCSAKTEFLPQFLVYQLQSLDCRKYFREHATGTAGSMPKINQKVVCSTPIKITNKKVQREIVQYIESRFTVCDNIEKTVNETLAQAEAMRQSILKKAFEGEL